MPDANRIPLSVSIIVCTNCGKYGVELDSCRAQNHRLSHVGYVISDNQTDSAAKRRIEDLRARNRRPPPAAPIEADDTALAEVTPSDDDTPSVDDTE